MLGGFWHSMKKGGNISLDFWSFMWPLTCENCIINRILKRCFVYCVFGWEEKFNPSVNINIFPMFEIIWLLVRVFNFCYLKNVCKTNYKFLSLDTYENFNIFDFINCLGISGIATMQIWFINKFYQNLDIFQKVF